MPQGRVTLDILKRAETEGYGARDMASILAFMRGKQDESGAFRRRLGRATPPPISPTGTRTLLEANGFAVDVHDTLAPLERPEDLADVDLITPIWSSARSGHRPNSAT